jgi:hypothetical protein
MMYEFPKHLEPGKDSIVLDDGSTPLVTASYALGERWAVEAGHQIIQLDPNVRVRIQRPISLRTGYIPPAVITHPLELPKLTRKKIGDQNYNIVDQDGNVVGNAVKTGTHLDNYPWDWSLADELYAQFKERAPRHRRSQGVEESLKVCVDTIAGLIAQFELKFPTHPQPPEGTQ